MTASAVHNRLSRRLASCRESGRKALTTFVTAGDPDAATTVPVLQALVAGGADVLELGVPFSDPEAEGPAIQRSSERSLAGGTRLRDVLAMAQGFRSLDDETPLVLMGYLNSVLAMGIERFADAARDAGVDGLILVNLPPEEAGELREALAARDIALVFLIAPTTTEARAMRILEVAAGFVYYVSLKGVTGAASLDLASLAPRLEWLRGHTDLPLQVGFGIKDGASAREAARHSDGVVVGSALVNTMADAVSAAGGGLDGEQRAALCARLQSQVGELRSALDELGPARESAAP